jgi:hypothetical protein
VGLSPSLTAAADYLGFSLSKYEKELTERWAKSYFLIWEDLFRTFERIRRRRAELEQQEKTGALTAELQIERGVWVWNLEGPEAAEPFLQTSHANFPDNPEAAFTLSRSLLAQDKEAGVTFMERVIGRTPSALRYQGTVEICKFLERHDRHEESVAFYNRMSREVDAVQKTVRERGHISLYDTFISHGLEAASVDQIRARVATFDWVIPAYIGRKPTSLSPGLPLYLLALRPRRKFLIPAFRAGMTAFDQVAALNCYSKETRFLLLDGSQPTLEKKVRKHPDSLLFKR